jgi:predicted GIY-YIG superfamily endonuclease
MYCVYRLLDYKGFCFYVGITKNIDVRIKEHAKNKNATPAKTYRVRKTIIKNGCLPYIVETFATKELALAEEKQLINKFRHQLVNKTHGKVKNESRQRRSKGKPEQCKTCKNWYRKINSHKCKGDQQ